MNFSEQHKQSLYSEFAKLLGAGFSVEASLKTLGEQPLPAPCMHFVKSMAAGIEAGKGIAESVRGIGEIEITGVELHLIEAGERGGGLAEVFEHLSEYFQRLHRSRRAIVRQLVYPAFLFHFAVAVSILLRALQVGNTWAAWWPSLVALLVFYGIAVSIMVGMRVFRKEGAKAQMLDAIFGRIPLVGSLRKSLSMERFCHVFKIYLTTAFKPSDAVKAAGEASQSAQLKRSSAKVSAQVAEGQRIGPLLHADAHFPRAFATSISTAEEAGAMDEDLGRWSKYYATQTQELLERLQNWIPRVVYVVVCVYVAWQIVKGFNNYFNMVMAPLG